MWKWSVFIIISVALLGGGVTYKNELLDYYRQLSGHHMAEKDRAVHLDKSPDETAMAHAEKHLDPTYVCPMHGQIIKNESGNCPICGMDLVEQDTDVSQSKGKGKAKNKQQKILYWVAPMDPNYRRDRPGQSPMGMDLVAVYAQEDQIAGVVTINPAVQQNIGVKTARVQRGDLWRKVSTVGYVEYDEDSMIN